MVKNIVIDLGGVIIDLDRSRCVRAFEAMGLAGADRMLGLYGQKEPFLSIETGKMSTARFYDHIRDLIGRSVPDCDIEQALDEFLVALPVSRLKALRDLRQCGYRTFMISNTNAVMFDGWIKNAFRREGLATGDYYDGIVTSFSEGVCKPDPALFSTLIDRYGLVASESLLLDDSEANCEAARRLGMKARRISEDYDFEHAVRCLLREKDCDAQHKA